MLVAAPTGISWSTLPTRNATFEQQLEVQLDICNRATAFAEGYCNQPLRATVDAEEFVGPDFRLTVQTTGLTRVTCSRTPVLAVVSAQFCSATAFPVTWSAIPANMLHVTHPVLGVTGSSAPGPGGGGPDIDIAPGYVTRYFGRGGYRLQVTYVNGFPHSGITATAAKGSTTLTVDDVTGWAGCVGQIFDGQRSEIVTCTATNPVGPGGSGPGTLTLSTGTLYDHTIRGDPALPLLVSAMPGDVQLACILHAVDQAMIRGATATTSPSLSGTMTGTGKHSMSYVEEAEFLLEPYRRVW